MTMKQIFFSHSSGRRVRFVILGGILLILGSLFSGITQAHAKYASIVIDANSGKILHQVNADTRNYPASLTKMMTLYMVFEAVNNGKLTMKSKIRFSKRAAGRPQTKLGVPHGGKITVEKAIGALIVRSANDVATAVAEHLGGSEAKFARLMTRKAKALGMSRTVFKNASGLPNRGQLSTARDMATMVRALQRHFPQYYHYFSLKKVSYNGKTYRSHNRLLGRYVGSDGVKTGYTRASGFNLASSVVRDNKRLIGIVFGGKSGKSRDKHMQTLLDRGFARVKALQFARAPIPSRKSAKKPAPQVTETTQTAEVAPKTTAKATPDIQPSPAPSAVSEAAATKTTVAAAPHTAPPLPKAYRNDGLARTIIVSAPQQIALVQDFKTGNPDYDGGGWSVQVGAYRKLSQATDFFSKLLSDTAAKQARYEKIILSQVNRKGSLYKPRLVGMKKSEAYSACKFFKAKKIDCLVISPNAG